VKAIISHGDNRTCPAVTQDGASHCPGHEVDVPEYGEQEFKEVIAQAYGRGYRRAFEDFINNHAAMILLISGRGIEQLRPVARNRLVKHMGEDAGKGWDSIE
jgi:hypothetical protein